MKTAQIPFAKFPKPLLRMPISNDAKLLYTLLSDRFQLSLKNGVTDEDGYPCCYFPNRQICEALHCAHDKATRLLRELEQAGMIYRRKLGRGRADCIYVGGIPEEEEVCRFPADRCADSALPGVPVFSSLECRFSAVWSADFQHQVRKKIVRTILSRRRRATHGFLPSWKD